MALTQRERLEIEKSRARRAGKEAPVIFEDRVVKPSTLAAEKERAGATPEAIRADEQRKIDEEKIRGEVRGPVTEEIIEEKRGTQEDILAREEERRAAEVVPEEPGFFDKVSGALKEIDTVGGIAPGAREDVVGEPMLIGGGATVAVKASKAALNSGKIATTLRSSKLITNMLNFFKTTAGKRLGKYGALGYVYFTERSLGNIDTALSQVRESLTLPVQMASVNPNDVTMAFDKITEYEDDILELEGMLKVREPFALTAKATGRTIPIYQRIKKLKDAIILSRGQIAKIEAEGRILTDEEQAILLSDMNTILDQMEEPSKFLGIL